MKTKQSEKFSVRKPNSHAGKKAYALTLDSQNQSLQMNSNLMETLKVPLWIGIILGIVPIQGLVSRKEASFKWVHYRTIISSFVTATLAIHTMCISYNFFVMILRGNNSARDLILTLSGVWFYFAGTFVYVFFLMKSQQICLFIKSWKDTSKRLSYFLLPDNSLTKNATMITAIVLIDCIGENILYHLHSMTGQGKAGSPSASEFLEKYFNSNEYIFHFFKYNPVISLAMLITNKLATIAWNFGDLILILLSRVIHERFWALNEYLRFQMKTQLYPLNSFRKDTVAWASIRSCFLQINILLHKANNIFSPLICVSCATDVFFISRQLYEEISPGPLQETLLNRIYLLWSLLHLIGRTLGMTAMATSMSEEAHKCFEIIQLCHPREHNEDVRRIEIFLGSTTIGLSGCGCFVITRAFIMMIISAIFTLEVVLIQNANISIG